MVSNNSLEPLILLGFISRVGVNFLIYYPLCLSFPFFIFILCLEETPATKNQPPEAKTKPDSPSASPLLPRESPLKKIPCLYREDRTQRGNGDLLCTEAASEAESSKALGVHAALFILKEELNSCKEEKLVTVFVFNC